MQFCTGAEEGMYWQRPWKLKAAVVHGWRGHRQQLTKLKAHPNELLIATAGRGNVAGQELEVLRCWNLAYAAAGDCSFDVLCLCLLCVACLCYVQTSVSCFALVCCVVKSGRLACCSVRPAVT